MQRNSSNEIEKFKQVKLISSVSDYTYQLEHSKYFYDYNRVHLLPFAVIIQLIDK